ncbi:hypothetical protein RJ640_005487 [Escallonia rubra]|uniref:Gnk2-homologous domain-containing protein n=1 Tax=Escallonia rubra TaxID=112253 RepID=A0AA88UML1_9ASTE|nr:hypothetical protein RJ640_005487 [Escallonia rubra]
MDYPRLTICFLFILSLITPQPIFAADVRCSDIGNYTTNSTYAANLKTLLSSISNSSNLDSDGFFNASIGQNPDKVYALALCKGDQEITSCRSCLNDSSQAITKECPNQKEAFLYKDECILRFSSRNILSSVDDGYFAMFYNVNNATNPAQFTELMEILLLNLREQAASGVVKKYAADVVKYTNLSKIYGLAQCTPDISKLDCGKCLDVAMNDITNHASGKVGAAITSLTTTQPKFAYGGCSNIGNYTTNSTYAANLKTLLSSISNSSDLNSDGFFNASIGKNPDQVYALALCRGDQKITDCRSCLNDSSQAITKVCPNQKEAILSKDTCMLRFSSRNILGSMDDGYVVMGNHVDNDTDPVQFTDVLRNLLFDLRERAASGGVRKYAADAVNFPLRANYQSRNDSDDGFSSRSLWASNKPFFHKRFSCVRLNY